VVGLELVVGALGELKLSVATKAARFTPGGVRLQTTTAYSKTNARTIALAATIFLGSALW
jgi:hypothetical protein